jgi:predicted nucleic acid-binding protein
VTRFVLDTSVALAWFFEDEHSDYSQFVSDVVTEDGAYVPVIWPLEVANGLLNAVRRGRLLQSDAQPILGSLARLRIEIEPGIALDTLGQTTLALALARRLSAYDASYLELALRRGVPLATQDKRLADAALAAGVELLQPGLT